MDINPLNRSLHKVLEAHRLRLRHWQRALATLKDVRKDKEQGLESLKQWLRSLKHFKAVQSDILRRRVPLFFGRKTVLNLRSLAAAKVEYCERMLHEAHLQQQLVRLNEQRLKRQFDWEFEVMFNFYEGFQVCQFALGSVPAPFPGPVMLSEDELAIFKQQTEQHYKRVKLNQD